MARDAFVYVGRPARVVFGPGTRARVGVEAQHLGMRRALLLSTPGHRPAAEALQAMASDLFAATFDQARMHTPVDVTERALVVLHEARVDGLVAIGGGSTIGLAKALALRTDLPQLVLPTTYAGSEMTDILGETAAGRKVTQRSSRVLPETVIYDVDLTRTLPLGLSAASGFNAMAHAMESLYAPDTNPVVQRCAEDGLAALARGLAGIARDLADDGARFDALYGAWQCGVCLGVTTMGLHHKLCHVLGGMFDLPHAPTHAVLLPHVLAFNAPAAPDAVGRVARALGTDDAPAFLQAAAASWSVPTALAGLGMPQRGIAAVVDAVLAAPYANPRPLEPLALHRLLTRAWEGAPASS